MEALRTHNDQLQWELQRLGVQNRRLRENRPEASKRVDQEAELEQARRDVAEMIERVRASEQRLAENAGAVKEAGFGRRGTS